VIFKLRFKELFVFSCVLLRFSSVRMSFLITILLRFIDTVGYALYPDETPISPRCDV